MTNEQQVAIREPEQDFALPTEARITKDLAAIHAFQGLVRSQLKEGHDYGTVPGIQRPTLLKPGAEKITKLLGLAEQYDILDRTEDWDKPLFRYLIRCRLVSIRTGQEITQGLGECNSMEAKYRWRWVWPDDLPTGFNKEGAVFRTVKGGGKQYRIPNDDIYSQVNTLLKMAEKRAKVDAALSVGRLSDLFTQDMEDLRGEAATEHADAPTETEGKPQNQYWCAEHQTLWFKRGKMEGYAHPIGDTKKWCNKPEEAVRLAPTAGEAPQQPQDWQEGHPETQGEERATEPAQTASAVVLPVGPPKNVGELLTWSLGFFNQSKQAVFDALHVRTAQEIADLGDAWATVKALWGSRWIKG